GVHERAVGDVLGLVVVADEAAGQVEHRALVPADQLLERPAVALSEAVDEDLVLAAGGAVPFGHRFGDGHAQHRKIDPVLASGVKRRYRTSPDSPEAKQKMLDPARIEAGLSRCPAAKPLIDAYLSADAKRRAFQGELDALRSQRNAATQGKPDAKQREALRALSQRIKEGEKELATLEAETREKQLWLPNAPHAS